MSNRKLVSICVPCFNEVNNAAPMADAIKKQMDALPQYDYEIIFIDNCSTDGTRDVLRELCQKDVHVKAILNSRNFGQFNSPYHALCSAGGDCAIAMGCDFQDPPALIPQMLRLWEEGHGVVCPIKVESEENPVLYYLRSKYYSLIKRLSSVEQIEQFTGFGLYGRPFLEVMKSLDDPMPFLRGIVAELGPADRALLPYEQQKRRSGKSHNNFLILYDAAMLSFTTYTKAPIRASVFVGIACVILSFISLVAMVLMALFGGSGTEGIIYSLLFLLVSISLFFTGILGEYVLAINQRSLRRPLVVESERLGKWE